MRRPIAVLAAVAALVAIAIFFYERAAIVETAGGGAGGGADDAAEAVRTGPARRERKRTAQEAAAEQVSAFLAQWPEKGQDVPQDPSLGAIRGRVLRGQDQPVDEGVVESSSRGELTARVRVKKGDFLLKNVPPGKGVALTARAPNYAPGGANGLLVQAGKTLDVGAIFLGAALDPDTTDRVEVHVTKADGEPVAGANVTATSTLASALVALGAWEKQPGGTVVRQTTDAKGVVVFEKLPPASYDFFAEAEGLAFEVEQRYLVQKDTQAVVTLEMEPGRTIEGKVVDKDGKPVAQAHVGVFRLNGITLYPGTSSDDDGRFVLAGLADGSYMLFGFKEDVGANEQQTAPAGAKDVTITLVGGNEMVLKVTDAATGNPVTSFSVRPYRVGPLGYLWSPHVDVSAADGVWRQTLAKQSWGVEVSAKGYAQKSLPSVPVPSKDPVEVKLDPAGVVHGRVTAKDGGTVIRGAKVYVKHGGIPPSPEKDQQTVTDENGEFVLDSMPRSTTTIWISHVDWSEQSFPVEGRPRGDKGELPPAADFVLTSGGRITGHAYDKDHKPLAGETITVSRGPMDYLSLRNATVAPDGAFDLHNVPPGTYRVTVGGAFGADAKNGVQVTDGGVATVDFGAETGGQKLTGRLVKDDESPVSGAGVVLDNGAGATQTATTDAQGAFAFENLAPGRYSLRSWGRTKTVDVTVAADEAPPEVVLTVLSGSIAGRIVDASTGQPLAGAWVDCEQTADASGNSPGASLRSRRGARLDESDGTFRFGSLDEGTYRIRAMRDPYGLEMADGVTLAAGEQKTGVEIRMTPGAGTLTGAVKTAGGLPLEGASLQVRDAQGRSVYSISLTTSSSDGSYTQAQLKPGEYDVTMEKEGFAPATQHVAIETAKTAHADFTMLQGGSVSVTALASASPHADPAAGVVVTLWDAAGRKVEKGLTLQNIFSSSTARTDAHGQITLHAVAAGSYTVKATNDAGAEAKATVDVVEGANAAVTLTFDTP
jgi:protocatechuate 3,4-dioxygenase beta subunit